MASLYLAYAHILASALKQGFLKDLWEFMFLMRVLILLLELWSCKGIHIY